MLQVRQRRLNRREIQSCSDVGPDRVPSVRVRVRERERDREREAGSGASVLYLERPRVPARNAALRPRQVRRQFALWCLEVVVPGRDPRYRKQSLSISNRRSVTITVTLGNRQTDGVEYSPRWSGHRGDFNMIGDNIGCRYDKVITGQCDR